jgi:signal transduction histidine kinase
LLNRSWIAPAVALVVGAAIAGLLAWNAHQRHEARVERDFVAEAEQIHHVMHRTVESYVDSLHALGAFFSASEQVTGGEFARFAEPLLARHAGVQAVGWAPSYPPERRSVAQSMLDAYGVPGVIDPRTGAVGTAHRDETVVPLLHVAPASLEHLRGVDLSSRIEIRTALQWARDSGGPAATAPVPLAGPSETDVGVILAMPVYAGAAPARSIVERRGRLDGYVVLHLDIAALLTQQLADFVGRDLEVAVVDAGVPEGRGLLYGPTDLPLRPAGVAEDGRPTVSRGLAVPARGWDVLYRPSQGYLDRLATREPFLILAGGLALSLIGAGWLGALSFGRQAVGRLVDQRTAELSRTAEALRQNEQRFRSLFANMRNLVFCRGAKGEDRYGYDREGTLIFGRDAPKLTGAVEGEHFDLETWYRSIYPDDRGLYEAAEQARKEEGRDYQLDYRVTHPVSGEERWMRETAWVVKDPETGQTFFDGYILDITDERRVADQLRTAKSEAERASRAKSEFLANMSHEIRTPLNAILGFSEAMRMEIFGRIGNPRYGEYAGHICDSAQHLLSLINDLLDLSKVEAGKLELEEEAVDPLEAVDEACRLIAAAASDAGLTLVRRVPEEAPFLWADRRLVRQILLNLVSNAVKFTEAGGEVRVGVAVDDDGGLALSVADTGAGIPPGEIDKVLQPFGQAAYHRTAEERGTGLGLPLARSLTEAHGGALRLESAVGVGTTVTCHFPAERVVAPPRTAERVADRAAGRAVG